MGVFRGGGSVLHYTFHYKHSKTLKGAPRHSKHVAITRHGSSHVEKHIIRPLTPRVSQLSVVFGPKKVKHIKKVRNKLNKRFCIMIVTVSRTRWFKTLYL